MTDAQTTQNPDRVRELVVERHEAGWMFFDSEDGQWHGPLESEQEATSDARTIARDHAKSGGAARLRVLARKDRRVRYEWRYGKGSRGGEGPAAAVSEKAPEPAPAPAVEPDNREDAMPDQTPENGTRPRLVAFTDSSGQVVAINPAHVVQIRAHTAEPGTRVELADPHDPIQLPLDFWVVYAALA